jgi:hypothetical protein
MEGGREGGWEREKGGREGGEGEGMETGDGEGGEGGKGGRREGGRDGGRRNEGFGHAQLLSCKEDQVCPCRAKIPCSRVQIT